MKPIKPDIQVISNITGEKIIMRLDEKSSIHLMSMFTDLYSDPKAAIIREISTNARDSHIEAGIDRPIEVTLPSAFAPFLTIRDWGTGLDEESIRTIFSLYGASTKRGTNKQTGALGLGGKSPLTYNSQFTVVGIKDGIKTVVSVSRDEDGSGSMTVVETVPTDEPNGVQVVIPTKRGDTLEQEAVDFFQYWKKGTVLVNGKEPERVNGLQVSDKLLLIKTESYYDDNKDDVVVMGGVAYPIPSEFKVTSSNGFYLVAEVEIGEIEFTPSREALQLSKRTKARLEELKDEFHKAAKAACEKEIAKSLHPYEALIAADSWIRALGLEPTNAGLVFHGKEIPVELLPPGVAKEQASRYGGGYYRGSSYGGEPATVSVIKSYRRGSSEKQWRLSGEEVSHTLFVNNFDVKFTAAHKEKLLKYLADKEIEGINAVSLSPKKWVSEWINPARIVDWSVIKAIKVPKTASSVSGQKAIAGSYTVWCPVEKSTVWEKEAAKIDKTKPIVYWTIDMFNGEWGFSSIVDMIREHNNEATIVKLGLNRVDKFKRDFPEAITAKKFLEKIYDELVSNIGKENIEAYTIQQNTPGMYLRYLEAEKVDDPQLKRGIKLASMKVGEKVAPIVNLRRRGLIYNLSNFSDEAYNVQKVYPLLEAASMHSSLAKKKEHLYLYLNAAYKKYKGQG